MYDRSQSHANNHQGVESPDRKGNDAEQRGQGDTPTSSNWTTHRSQHRDPGMSSQESERGWEGSRRRFIAGATSLTIGGFLAGCTSSNWGGSDNGSDQFGGSLENVSNYDGVVDSTGNDAIMITVGAEGNGSSYAFDPPAVRITPGTTATFDWVSNTNNVVFTDQPEEANWNDEPEIKNSGYSFVSTFDSTGLTSTSVSPIVRVE